MAKKALGKGLDALFQTYEAGITEKDNNKNEIKEIKIQDIDPNLDQPRKNFNQESIEELVASIKEHGIIQPILVKPEKERYTIIAGERRWRAARLAGLEKVPAIVMDVDKNEMLMIALVENLQREDLDPIEEAEGIRMLMKDYNLTQEQVAQKIGKSRPVITNALRLLSLSAKIQSYIKENKLTAGHARALLGLEDNKKREEVAELIIEKELSVRETEKLIKKIKDGEKNEKQNKEKPGYIIDIENKLEESLGTRVVITQGKKKGVIEIEYYNNDDLERIMEKILQ